MTNLLFKLKYHLYRPSAFKMARMLEESQFWSDDRWLLHQILQRRVIVDFAFENIEFYKRHYKNAGIKVRDLEQENWFEYLPIVTKQDVKEYFEEMCAANSKQHMGISSTGGSTGEPVKFGYDRRIPFEAWGWRMLGWWGLTPADSGGYVWRDRRGRGLAGLANELLWYPTRKLRLDASVMDRRAILDFIKRWNKIKPPQLQGYVGAMAELAQFVEKENIPFEPPKVVWVTSSPLSIVQRALLERVFKAPVYDQYGACEVPHIAAQCEQRGGLHVNAERVGVEFVDAANKPVGVGEWGKTLLTRYDDQVFPLIRYEVGDTGRWLGKPCPCGRTLPLIDQVKGRTTDVVRLPSGKIISGDYLTTIFDDHPDAISSFRVIKKRGGVLCVEYVPAQNQNVASVISEVERTLAAKLNGELSLEFKQVAKIAHDRGKLKFVINEEEAASEQQRVNSKR